MVKGQKHAISIEELEVAMKDAELSGDGVKYRLMCDRLGITNPSFPELYAEGEDILKVEESLLEKIANEYEDARESERPKQQKRILSYSIEQHTLDKGIMGYMQIKRSNLKNYEQALEFLERFKGQTLKGEQGKTIPLKECKSSRIIAVAMGMYNTAQTRLAEYNKGERTIVNGTP